MSTPSPVSERPSPPSSPIEDLFDAARPVGSYVRIEPTLGSAIWARFVEPFTAGREPVARSISLSSELSTEELFAGVPEHLIRLDSASANHRLVLIEAGSFTALIQQTQGHSMVTVLAPTHAEVQVAVAQVSEWFPAPTRVDDAVPVDFWQSGSRMYTTTRAIDAPTWDDVAHHYPGEVGEQLDAVMRMTIDQPVGRVLLWHGRPGTGKTSAIRTLARAWRDQARFQVVLDPESAFAGSTALMQMLLAENAEDNERWRILVIEDADPLVAADGNTRTLSRLLNVGDGIVGQGIRVMVLLTTNQPPSRLHPAVARPGRCLSEIEFRRFSANEAIEAFPDRHDELATRSGDLSLAEILTGADDVSDGDTEAFGQYL